MKRKGNHKPPRERVVSVRLTEREWSLIRQAARLGAGSEFMRTVAVAEAERRFAAKGARWHTKTQTVGSTIKVDSVTYS